MSSPAPELERCPFCGGPAAVQDWQGGYDISCQASWSDCPVALRVRMQSRDDAVRVWNTRAAETELREALKDLVQAKDDYDLYVNGGVMARALIDVDEMRRKGKAAFERARELISNSGASTDEK